MNCLNCCMHVNVQPIVDWTGPGLCVFIVTCVGGSKEMLNHYIT